MCVCVQCVVLCCVLFACVVLLIVYLYQMQEHDNTWLVQMCGQELWALAMFASSKHSVCDVDVSWPVSIQRPAEPRSLSCLPCSGLALCLSGGERLQRAGRAGRATHLLTS